MQKKVLRNKKTAELKNANSVQNSHSFFPHLQNHSHHSHHLIPHISGLLDHSQSFIPHFLNSRLLFSIIFSLVSKKFDTPSIKLPYAMKPIGNEKNTHFVFFSQS